MFSLYFTFLYFTFIHAFFSFSLFSPIPLFLTSVLCFLSHFQHLFCVTPHYMSHISIKFQFLYIDVICGILAPVDGLNKIRNFVNWRYFLSFFPYCIAPKSYHSTIILRLSFRIFINSYFVF